MAFGKAGSSVSLALNLLCLFVSSLQGAHFASVFSIFQNLIVSRDPESWGDSSFLSSFGLAALVMALMVELFG